MNRIRLKKKYVLNKRLKTSEKLILILLLLFITIIISFNIISNKITPVLINYAEIEAKKFINSIVNKAVSKTKIDNIDNLFIISKTDEQINTIDFNVNSVNEMLTEINTKIQEMIQLMDKGSLTDISGYDNDKLKTGIIYEIPSGVIFNNNLLSNIGPKIPVKISMRGSISSNIDTNISNYGINNALIKVSIKLVMDEQVLLPFTLKKIQVENNIPVVLKIIEGNVPKYYSGGINESSPIISIPLEEY